MKRNTIQKTAINQVLDSSDLPLNAEKLLENAREFAPRMNLATLYRNLKLLIEEGSVTKISHPDSGILYEKTAEEHHHHFYCRICKQTIDLPGCPLQTVSLAPADFIAESHELFISGVCSSCKDKL